MIIGTCHFVSRDKAAAYFRDQCYGDGYATVTRKERDGEIYIGPPVLKPGQVLTIIDKGARYAIVEHEGHDYPRLARELWDRMDPDERHGVRFGLFPAGVMEEQTHKGADGRKLAVALMDVASKNGGMRA